MDHNTDTDTQVILARARDDEGCSNRLEGSWRKHDPRLLIATINNVPVDLNNAQVEPLIELNVESTTKGHRETRLICMKVADAEERRQLRAIDVYFLNGDPEQRVPKWLERWSIFGVVFYLNAAEEVLQCSINGAASERTSEFVFTQM